MIVTTTLWIKQRDVVTLASNLLVYVRPIYLLLAQTVLAGGWSTRHMFRRIPIHSLSHA